MKKKEVLASVEELSFFEYLATYPEFWLGLVFIFGLLGVVGYLEWRFNDQEAYFRRLFYKIERIIAHLDIPTPEEERANIRMANMKRKAQIEEAQKEIDKRMKEEEKDS